jgi:acid phosphatase family membrane protein YuiD
MGSFFIIICAATAWFVAQFLKVFTGIFKVKKFSVAELLFGTGGMPSSHSASVCALATACAIKCGFDSPAFAISLVLALIVMRDAMGMRRQVGEQAKALNKLFETLSKNLNDPELTEKTLEELAGHTPLQVLAGMLVGLLIPIGLMFIPVFEVGPNFVEAASSAIHGFIFSVV